MRFMPAASALLAGLVLFTSLAVPSRAHALSARTAVEGVAETIEAHYWDPEAGHRIAASLRTRAAQGRFDADTDPAELASSLSAALAEHDRHFRVTWMAPSDAAAADGARDRPPGPAETALRELRSGHGIHRVQRLPGNIGLLELTHFADIPADDPDPPARRGIDAALDVLAGIDALLIDLRDNGGGSPAMVGYLASAFLAPGADAYNVFRFRGGSASEAPAVPYPRPDPDLPVFVLTGPRTGSAAEAFAYTLQQAGRARVVGAASAGAANPGRRFDAGHGLHVFVSTGSPRNPNSGDNWEGRGVRPDLPATVADAEAVAHRAALEAGLARLSGPAAEEARWLLAAYSAPADDRIDTAVAGRYGDVALESRADGLWLRQGRRPERRLRPLAPDLFTDVDDPTRRVRILRSPEAIVALELLDPWDPPQRYRRDPATGHDR